MQLADDILNDTVVPSSNSSVATFNYTPSPVDGYNTLDGNINEDGNTTHDDRLLDLGQQSQEDNFNLKTYLHFIPK